MMSLMLMTFLSAVEGTIVSTAIPRITSDLSGVELVGWVYAITCLPQQFQPNIRKAS